MEKNIKETLIRLQKEIKEEEEYKQIAQKRLKELKEEKERCIKTLLELEDQTYIKEEENEN